MKIIAFREKRTGATLPLVVFLMIVLLAMAALAIDIGYIALCKAELQAAADASATAAGGVMKYDEPSEIQSDSINAAKTCAAANVIGGKSCILADSDIEFGNWDDEAHTFTKNQKPYNAVRVVARRNNSNAQGPVSLFFGKIIGHPTANLTASSIALVQPGGGTGTRFLIDDEMIDSDEPAIEAVAKNAGKNSDYIIEDNDGDWFIDLHKFVSPGQILELPTGQIGDEGLFDILANEGTKYKTFPFGEDTNPSLKDFLNYNEDSSSWRYDLIDTEDLDPLHGVGRWNDPDRYESLVNPDFIHVSPVFDSDVSALDSVGEPAVNGVNALGERRGLLAFKIVGVGKDPDGNGSVLPYLQIEVVDPATINLDEVKKGDKGNSGTGSVRLVR